MTYLARKPEPRQLELKPTRKRPTLRYVQLLERDLMERNVAIEELCKRIRRLEADNKRLRAAGR